VVWTSKITAICFLLPGLIFFIHKLSNMFKEKLMHAKLDPKYNSKMTDPSKIH